MTVQAMIVQTDTWMGAPNQQGSFFVKKGTLVMVNTASSVMVANYGGMGNLVATGPIGDGESSDRSAQAD